MFTKWRFILALSFVALISFSLVGESALALEPSPTPEGVERRDAQLRPVPEPGSESTEYGRWLGDGSTPSSPAESPVTGAPSEPPAAAAETVHGPDNAESKTQTNVNEASARPKAGSAEGDSRLSQVPKPQGCQWPS